MKILLSGSYGLIGTALIPHLTQAGHTVTRLVRVNGQPGLLWNPDNNLITSTPFEGFDAVIHLAGENIASGRWTEEKKKRIRDSRIRGTQMLTSVLTRLQNPPSIMICASAVGYYGNRGEEVLREDSPAGKGFLAEVCRAWEAAAAPAADKGIRVVHLRFGVVLSSAGGALMHMVPAFKLGAGGKIGSGKQYMSWVAIDDAVQIILHVLRTPALKGPVNVTAPDPAPNEIFAKTLGRVLSRPTLLPMPAFAARLVFGDMANELLLASQRTEPKALHKSGYAFRYPALEGALRHVLKK